MVVDKRFDKGSMELVASMIGKEFKKYRCDPFIFNNMLYKIVSLFIGDEVYQLQNNANVQEYFGATEDICNICITPVSISDARSSLDNVAQIDIPFNAPIEQIILVDETQCMYNGDQLIDEYSFVRCIIFVLSDGRKVSFEKTDDFSEQIAIRRGYNLINQISPVQACTDLESGYCMKTIRNIQRIA